MMLKLFEFSGAFSNLDGLLSSDAADWNSSWGPLNSLSGQLCINLRSHKSSTMLSKSRGIVCSGGILSSSDRDVGMLQRMTSLLWAQILHHCDFAFTEDWCRHTQK